MYIRRKVFSKVENDCEKLFSVTETEIVGQKEFGEVKRANKAKKKAWELTQGKKDYGLANAAKNIKESKAKNKINLGYGLRTSGNPDNYKASSQEIKIHNARTNIRLENSSKPIYDIGSVNESINTREAANKSIFNRGVEKEAVRDINKNLSGNKSYKENLLKKAKQRTSDNVEKNTGKILSKNKKIALGVGAGLAAGAAGVAAYKHYKNKKKEDK